MASISAAQGQRICPQLRPVRPRRRLPWHSFGSCLFASRCNTVGNVCLTLRSSGLAFGQPLTSPVSTTENQFISPMLFQTAFSFSSVVQRWVCRFSGLRLLALRGFLFFLASSPCATSASSYCFRSAVPPRWRCAFSQFVPVAKSKLPVLASGSNISVKPTRILRSAYLAR